MAAASSWLSMTDASVGWPGCPGSLDINVVSLGHEPARSGQVLVKRNDRGVGVRRRRRRRPVGFLTRAPPRCRGPARRSARRRDRPAPTAGEHWRCSSAERGPGTPSLPPSAERGGPRQTGRSVRFVRVDPPTNAPIQSAAKPDQGHAVAQGQHHRRDARIGRHMLVERDDGRCIRVGRRGVEHPPGPQDVVHHDEAVRR